MYVVLRGITIWALYALASCVPVACQSSADEVALKWGELLFDPISNEPFERLVNQINKRYSGMNKHLNQQRAMAQSKRYDVTAISKPPCDCTKNHGLMHLGSGHYPRTLKAAECHEFNYCKKFVYPMIVLTEENYNEESYVNTVLPREIQGLSKYRWVQVNVTAACSCEPLT